VPSLPLRPCTMPGCGLLVTSGRCAAHTTRYHDTRPSASQRGYGAAWQRLAAQVIAEEPACRACGSTAPSAHVDHIVARNDGGTDARANLQRLCARCHSSKTAKYDGGFGNTKYRNTKRATQIVPHVPCQRA
jgi:5-methylcytosine-specific restriction protein A